MEKYINKRELLPGLIRALFAFFLIYMVFTGRVTPSSLKIASSGEELLMTLMFVLMGYTIGSLFVPEKNQVLSIILLLIDGSLLIAVVHATGNAASLFAYLLPLLVPNAAIRLGTKLAPGAGVAAGGYIIAVSIQAHPGDLYRFFFWGIYFIAAWLLSALLLQDTDSRRYDQSYFKMEERNQELEHKVAEMERNLSMYTIVDGITGMKNFRYFRARVEEEIKRARRLKYPFSIAVLGIDEFQEYAAHFGKQEADRALIKIGQALDRNVRDTDLVAKYVDDQFLLLLPQSNPRQAITPAMRIGKRLKTLTFGPAGNFEFHYSFGISGFPEDVQEIGALFNLASSALDRSRRRGKGMITLASSLNAPQK